MKALLAAVILAHSWYPHECCVDGSCRPIPCSELHESGRYLMRGADWIEKSEVRISPDAQCHTCDVSSSGRMYCVWMPRATS